MEAVIVGSSMTGFGMFTPTRLRELAAEAAAGALASSGFAAKEIGLVVFGNAAAGILTGQEMIRSQVLLGGSSLAGRPMVNVENACASSSTAFHLACLAVASGTYDAVLAVGAEKMTSEDRALAARALASALDVEESPYALGNRRQGEAVRPVFMEIYAAAARRYMESSGATASDLAAVAAKATRNGALNPIAQVRYPLTVEEVLAARLIVDPLTRPMCSSIGDGAAAVVVCSPELAKHRRREAVHVLASVVGSAGPNGPDDLVERTATAAYEQAGLGPDDIDVMEVHDAAASAELIIYEEVGLAGRGQGVALLRSGVTDLGGRCPVNPSGGLIARGHPIGATGIAQLVELDTQLRGHAGARQVEGAQLALAQNAGGDIGPGPAVCAVTILAAA